MNKNVAAYILAGGQSRRIGYDKLFAPIPKLSLIENSLLICQQVCNPVKIAAKMKDKFASLGVEVVIDDPDTDGPLAGIIAILEDCSDDYCFVTAADFYDLNSNLVSTIIENYNNEQYFSFKINDRIQPLCGIYHKSTLSVMKEAALQSNYKMFEILKNLETRTLPITINPWRNINNSEDLEFIRGENV